jgi:hypothetical protein
MSMVICGHNLNVLNVLNEFKLIVPIVVITVVLKNMLFGNVHNVYSSVRLINSSAFAYCVRNASHNADDRSSRSL